MIMTPGPVTAAEEKKKHAVTMDAGALEDGDEAAAFKTLSAEEAREFRRVHPTVSPWRVVIGQALLGLVVTLIAWWVSGQGRVAWSAGYGALAVVIPAAVFARGLGSPLALRDPGSATLGFFLWEAVKIGLTVAMLFAAPHWVKDLSWPAMLVGLVVTMKLYWFVPALGAMFQVRNKSN